MNKNFRGPAVPLPEPATQRGRDTREEILEAAGRLLRERWVEDIPYTALASAAGVARASLIHAFPRWRDVLYILWHQEIERLDEGYVAAQKMKRARPDARVYTMLRLILDRAESTGLLYPNLRSAMFTWHGEPAPEEYNADPSSAPPSPAMLGAYVRIQLSDHFAAVEDLLGMPATYGKPVGPVPIGECLVNFALDLAAGSPTYRGSFDERRATLRKTIVVVSAGTRSVR